MATAASMASQSCSLNHSLVVPPFKPEPLPGSPVSWQVLVWVLLSLAINSMAQPSGRIVPRIPNQFRLYLCSSPIICMADALSMITQFIAIWIYVRIPARTAALVVVHGRGENTLQDALKSMDKQKEETETYLSAAWPRWLFFVLGGLPPAIKLGSLSGVPWTQTWGYFFISSFVVIEVFTFIAQDVLHTEEAMKSNSVDSGTTGTITPSIKMASLTAEYLMLTQVGEPHIPSVKTALFMLVLPDYMLGEGEEIRPRIVRVSSMLDWTPTVLFGIAIIVQIGMWVWAAGTIWILANVEVRRLFIHCVISKEITNAFLNAAISIMEALEEISRTPIASEPAMNNFLGAGLLELKAIQENGCTIDLPFAVSLLEFVSFWAKENSAVTQDWPGVLENFEEYQSQNCGVPLSFEIASAVVQASLALVSLLVVFMAVMPKPVRRSLGMDNERWDRRGFWLWLWFSTAFSAWCFVPVHHNGRLNWWKTTKLSGQVLIWLGIFCFYLHCFLIWVCQQWPRLGLLLLIYPRQDEQESNTDDEQNNEENQQQATPDENRSSIANQGNETEEQDGGQEHGIELAELPRTEDSYTRAEVAEASPNAERPSNDAVEISEAEVAVTDPEMGTRGEPDQLNPAMASIQEALDNIERSSALCFFITNLLVCVLWYSFKYDSQGTSDPSWTQVFG